jgi:two-component system, chemotaxis family, response regulator Rcp1
LPAKFVILLVEDNAADVFLLREAWGDLPPCAEFHVARDGREALRVLHGTGEALLPDLILLDLNLPVMNGYDVLQALKSDPRTRAIPVIILSSSGAATDVNKSYQLQANSYVQKPKDLDGLFQMVSGIRSFWLQTAQLPPHGLTSVPS